MKIEDDRPSKSPLTYSMMCSEVVYKLVVLIERVIRWVSRAVLRPYAFLIRCLVS